MKKTPFDIAIFSDKRFDNKLPTPNIFGGKLLWKFGVKILVNYQRILVAEDVDRHFVTKIWLQNSDNMRKRHQV